MNKKHGFGFGLGRAGSIVIMTAAGAVFLVGLVAMVTDVGWMYYQNARIQTSVNAGWKAGFDYYTLQLRNNPTNSDFANPDSKVRAATNQIVLEAMRLNGYPEAQGEVVTNFNPFTVRQTSNSGLFFARVLNFNDFNVTAQRVGEPMYGFGGAVPLAIPHGVVKDLSGNTFSYESFSELGAPGFSEGREYILKLGSGGGGKPHVPTGDEKQKNNWGVIDPDNETAGGAKAYGEWFMYGFSGPLSVNDRVMTEAGNMTLGDKHVEYRLDSPATGARRIIVPIVDIPPEVKANNPLNATAETIYDIQGTDHPAGVYDPDLYAFGSSVRIIGFAEFELLDEDDYTRDGTTVESGDSGDLGPTQTGQIRGTFVRYVIQPGTVPVE